MDAELVRILHIQKSSLQTQKIQDFFQNREFACPFNAYFEYTRVANLKKALEELEKDEYDIILLKVRTTCYSNIDKLNQLKAIAPDVPVIILCDAMRDKTGSKALNNGAADCLNARGISGELILRSVMLWYSRSKCKKYKAMQNSDTLLSSIIREIDKFSDDELEDNIESILSIIGESYEADYIRTYEFHENHNATINLMDHWAEKGIVKTDGQSIKVKRNDWFSSILNKLDLKQTQQFESLLDVDGLNDDVRKILTPLDDAAISICPIRRKDHLWGFIVLGFFDASKLPCEMDRLAAASLILDLIYERKQLFDSFNHLTTTLRLINKILRHDIMNNLSSVYGILEMFSKSQDEELIESSSEAIERSLSFIDKMRDYESSLIMGKNLERVKLAPIIKKLTNIPKMKFEVNLEGNYFVYADSALSTVLWNIIQNAVNHSGTDKIKIDITRDGDLIKIAIIDFGKGIKKRFKSEVFKEGFALGENKGSGLGLYIVSEVIERYDGKINIRDNKPKGTIFEIILDKA